jgi:Na+-translocating ferredoxin:NAD+ oxidoreductase RnfA subunit
VVALIIAVTAVVTSALSFFVLKPLGLESLNTALFVL